MHHEQFTERTHHADQDGPLVSIVTPFYNTAQYLEQCIESVLGQTYGNFEYILADNCSTDESLAIAKRYAARDPRVRVIEHDAHIGQDPNYNRALKYISDDAKYCKIVQADDWITSECVQRMVGLAEAHPRVGIVSCCFIAGQSLIGNGLPFDRDVFSGREACRVRLLTGHTYFGSPTNLLYRADLVRERPVFFTDGETNADTVACFEILRQSDFARAPQILAHLRRQSDSTSAELSRRGTTSFVTYALIKRFGPEYLEPAELEAKLAQSESAYLHTLAKAFLAGAGRDYWLHHQQLMRSLGRDLPKARVGVCVIDTVLDQVLNPRRSIRGLAARLRSKQNEYEQTPGTNLSRASRQ